METFGEAEFFAVLLFFLTKQGVKAGLIISQQSRHLRYLNENKTDFRFPVAAQGQVSFLYGVVEKKVFHLPLYRQVLVLSPGGGIIRAVYLCLMKAKCTFVLYRCKDYYDLFC
jgi:hypothetical protein